MALTTSQLTFYDMVDDEVSFAIYSEGNTSDNKISLMATVTKQGAGLEGNYTWYSSVDSFRAPIGSLPQMQIASGQDMVLKCDFSYPNSANVAYTAYFNVSNSRMVYTTRPADGNYLAGDLWYVGDDYVATMTDGTMISTGTSGYSNVLLVAQQAGGGTYKSTDWVLAIDYNGKFEEYDGKLEGIYDTTNNLSSQVDTLNLWKGNMANFVEWTSDGGLQFTGKNKDGDTWSDGNFLAKITSDKLIFLFRENVNSPYQETAWIGGENIQGDGHSQFFVYDATVARTLDVSGLLTCQNFTMVHPQKDNTLILQPEGNGSFSIVVGKK